MKLWFLGRRADFIRRVIVKAGQGRGLHSANQPHQMIGGAQGAYVVDPEYSVYGDCYSPTWAATGALIGSFFALGVGTLIGAAVGGLVGGIAGADVAGYAGNALGRHGRENAASARRWWEL